MVKVGALNRSMATAADVFATQPAVADASAPTAAAAASKPQGVRKQLLAPPNVCIVDPPRKGLDPEVLTALATPKGAGSMFTTVRAGAPETSALTRLIYISCGFKALKRDTETLIGPNGGGWRIAHAEGHVLFPGSDHLETLVVFAR
jgi:tRNA/tmRNA/rRNA uracil-C5-methylase (TrmA/RlmC/RlmD family)